MGGLCSSWLINHVSLPAHEFSWGLTSLTQLLVERKTECSKKHNSSFSPNVSTTLLMWFL